MDVSEYIDAVTGQMRCKRARAMVAKELSDHIADQAQDYLKEGMEPGEAQREAVRQMGDAIEVGMEMDRLHRPGMDKRVLWVVAVFSLVAMFLQTMLVLSIRIVGGLDSVSSKAVPFQVLLGVLIMVGIMYLDYTFLGKHPLLPWLILVCFPIFCDVAGLPCERICMYVMLGLLVPAYVGVIYRYRTKGWLGLLASVCWLVAGVFLYYREMNRFFLMVLVCLMGMLLLSYALAKGWYGISKVGSVAALWGVVLGGLVLLLLIGGLETYQIARLEAYFNYGADPAGHGYMANYMHVVLGEVKLWQSPGEWICLWGEAGYPLESAMSFLLLLKQMGVIPAVLILAGFVVLFLDMAAGVSKQKNVLGSLLGMACVLSLLVPTICHVLNNLALLPYTDIYIPFLYPGWVANAISYTLLGLYLSVYRNKDVVA